MLGMFFLGMVDSTCAVCGEQIFDDASDYLDQGMPAGNAPDCIRMEKPHKVHRKCLEWAAAKKVEKDEPTFCCDCQILLTDQQVIDDYVHMQKYTH